MGLMPRPRKVPAFLDVLPFPGLGEEGGGVPCLHCSSPLTLHQPHLDSPDRLLGVCEDCRRWYLVDLRAGQSVGFLVGLPGDEVVRELSHENPPDGISLMGPDLDPGQPV